MIMASSNEPPDAIFQTPAWLMTEANLPVAKLKARFVIKDGDKADD